MPAMTRKSGICALGSPYIYLNFVSRRDFYLIGLQAPCKLNQCDAASANGITISIFAL